MSNFIKIFSRRIKILENFFSESKNFEKYIKICKKKANQSGGFTEYRANRKRWVWTAVELHGLTNLELKISSLHCYTPENFFGTLHFLFPVFYFLVE